MFAAQVEQVDHFHDLCVIVRHCAGLAERRS
jgi:hypothetical protein